MNNLPANKQNGLPAIPSVKDLYIDTEAAFKKDKLNYLLNQPPHAPWIKKHPYIPNHKYLPIDKVEFLLKRIFKRYRIEVLKTGMLLNSVECTVRVWYESPSTGQLEFHDGVGAEELQTMQGTGTLKADMSNLNKGAVKMALPIAKSVAIKDACDHLGTVFGSDINRKDTVQFIPNISAKDVQAKKEFERMVSLIEHAQTLSDLEKLKPHLTPETQEIWNLRFDALQ